MTAFKPITQNDHLIIKIMTDPDRWLAKNDVDHLAVAYKDAKRYVDSWNKESKKAKKECLIGVHKSKYDLFAKYIAFIDDLRKKVTV